MKKIINFIKWMLLAIFAGSIFLVFLFKWVPVPCTPLMFIRAYQQMERGEKIRWHHEWVPLDSISPDLPLAVWSSEDQNYFNHNGFDFDAIQKVIAERESGKRMRGGSTISQQTAKNVFLFPTAANGKMAWVRKGIEAYYTLLIEFVWDKRRIMEVYLNSIEMGDGIYGAEAVAREHFERSAKDLTRNQCALIAISLPNPLKFNSAKPTRYMYKRQLWCTRQMRYLGSFEAEWEKQQKGEDTTLKNKKK